MIIVSVAIKIKNNSAFLIKKLCSSFITTLNKNEGKIMHINSIYSIKLFRAKILKRVDNIKLIKIRNEPKILKNAPFLP